MNTAVIARTGLLLARRQIWHAGRLQRGVLPMLLVLLFAGGTWFGLGTLFEALAQTEAPEAWSASVLGWTFTLSAVMVFLGGLYVTVSTLIADRDLERLIATPLSSSSLLMLKAMATLPRTLPPVLGIALPAAVVYLMARPEAPPFAWALPIALLTLWAVPLSLAVLVALPLLRLTPPTRLRESLAVLATVAFLAGWLANAFWMPRLLSDGETLAAGLRAMPTPPEWSPATWAARALGSRTAVESVIACIVASTIALFAAAHIARGLLGTLHTRMAAAAGRVVRSSARRAPTLAAAFLRRDAALVTRDWPVMLDAFAQFSLWTLLPLAVLPVAPLPPLELARDMLIALSVSLGNDVAARALPLERGALAWARLSPVGGASWVRRRALGVAIVSGAVLAVAATLVCATLRLGPAECLDAVVFALAASASLTGAGLALGAFLGDPTWTDPRAMLGPGGRSAAAAVLLAIAAGWLALSHVLSPTRGLGLLMELALLLLGLLMGGLGVALAAHRLEHQEFKNR